MSKLDRKLQALVEIGTLYHRHLGPVQFTQVCALLQSTNPDPTSIFVEKDGDILEVSMALVHFGRDESPMTDGDSEPNAEA